jgi:regulator of RNase E activity RraA
VKDAGPLSDDRIERALRWALIELGTAGLADELGADVVVPGAPHTVSPATAAVAGPIVLMQRSRDGARAGASSFSELREHVRPGSVVLVGLAAGVEAAFGSNVVLHAACLRAQALISDGPARDTTRAAQVGLVVGHDGTNPRRPAGAAMRRIDSADMFGTTWRDGDWFLRDADGVIRLAPEQAQRAAGRVAENATGEFDALLAGV